MNKSRKQKLNTNSSAKPEIIGLSEFLSNCLWYEFFTGLNVWYYKSHHIAKDKYDCMAIKPNQVVNTHNISVEGASLVKIV